MDTKSLMTSLLSSGTLDALSSQTGTPKNQLTSVLESVLPTMLDGANSQATGQDTAESFQNAINTHAKDDTSDLTSFFGKVDLEDGAKIIGHLLGAGASSATEAATNASGLSSSDVAKIMSMVAPLILSSLGQQSQSAKPDKGGILAMLLKLFK